MLQLKWFWCSCISLILSSLRSEPLSAAMYYLTLTASEPASYAAAQIIALLAYGFSVPFLFGVCSELDKSGRIMAAATGLQMLGLALAPWIAGLVITEYSYTHLASLVVGTCLLTLVLALKSLANINNDSNSING